MIVTETLVRKSLRQHQQRPFSHQIFAAFLAHQQRFSIPEQFQIYIRKRETSRPSGSKDWLCDVQRISMLIKHFLRNGWWAITRRLDSVSVECCVERIRTASRWINSPNCLFLSIHERIGIERSSNFVFPLENSLDCWRYKSQHVGNEPSLFLPSGASN